MRKVLISAVLTAMFVLSCVLVPGAKPVFAENVLVLISPDEEELDMLRDDFYNLLEEAEMDYGDEVDFAMIDMDRDGVNELVLVRDDDSFDVYTGVEGEAQWIGGYEQYAKLYRPFEDMGLYAVMDKKGTRYIDRIFIRDDGDGPVLDSERVSTSKKTKKTFSDGIELETRNVQVFLEEGDELYLHPNDEFIFPDGDSRYLTVRDLEGLDARTLRLARNEFYARRGRVFQSEDLGGYFRSKSWYNPTISAEDFDDGVFNKYESYNVELIWNYEHGIKGVKR